jgi:hypothetical protein
MKQWNLALVPAMAQTSISFRIRTTITFIILVGNQAYVLPQDG